MPDHNNTKETAMTNNDTNPENAPETHEQPAEAPESAPAPEDAGDGDLSTDSESSALAKVRKEAAGHRAKLREAEAERDALRTRADALSAMVLESALKGSGVNAELFKAAGHTVEGFISDGALDRSALSAAVRDTAKAYGLRVGSPWAGTGDERPLLESDKPSWAGANSYAKDRK